ncbi:Down syndrome cell adhesion molecule-like protein 1 [Chamberlinius hualienensis]
MSSAGQLFVTASQGNVAPRISDSVNTVSVLEGKTVILPCAMQGYPIPTSKWYTKSESNSELKPIRSTQRLVAAKSFLLIRNVKTDDENFYMCEANSEVGKDNLIIKLNVIKKVSVNVTPKQHQARMGDSAAFNCKSSVQPITSITWFHNGEIITSAVRANYNVENIQLHHQGMYQCAIKINDNTYLSSAQLNLTEMQPYFVDTFKTMIVQPGEEINVKCSAGGIPRPIITWNIDGMISNIQNTTSIKFENTKDLILSTFTIRKAKTEDGGIYECIASSRAGEITHNARPTGVKKTPNKIAVSGEKVILNCPMFGYPWESITWKKNGEILPNDLRQFVFTNGSLRITNVHRSMDTGSYKCQVIGANATNKAEGSLNLQVMIPPKIVPFEFQEDLLREGMRARLQCVVSEGDLPLKVSWLKDGKPFDEAMGVTIRNLDDFSSILTIASITPSHNGNYTCVASNTAASTSHNAQLSVNGK